MTDDSAPFLDAAHGRIGTHTPVWFMRQAGRSLPEYRGVRGEGSILHAIKQPEVATEITLQPVRRYGVDAAVLYSDIVVPPHAVGFGIDVTPGTGPVAETPLRSRDDLTRLRPLAVEDVSYVVDTVELLSQELPNSVPLLAFGGAPFTVGSYLIEGQPSRDYRFTKSMMHRDPSLFHDVMDRLATSAITFIDAQLCAGAQAFQLFDSWAGSLDETTYRRFVLPHSTRVFAEPPYAFTPTLHACTSESGAIISSMRCTRRCPALAHGSSASTGEHRSAKARRRLGADLVVQGNLDPALILAGTDVAVAGAERVLADNATEQGRRHPGHIFNLGHGVSQFSDPNVLQAVVDHVHTTTAATTDV